MSSGYLEAHRRHLGEYYALLLFAVIGMDLMAAARDFILFYVAFELMAISSYLLAAFFRYRVRSNESALKYFLTGSFASAIMLYGISLVVRRGGVHQLPGRRAGAGRRRAATAGVLFAVFLVGDRPGLQGLGGAVPHVDPRRLPGRAHPGRRPSSRWGPRRRPSRCSSRPSSWPSRGRLHEWGVFFIVLSVVTMLVGNLFALVQTNVKRMLAYSSIAHAGYLLGGLGAMGWSKQHLPGARAC